MGMPTNAQNTQNWLIFTQNLLEFRGYLESSVISKALPSSNETTTKHCVANEPNDAKSIVWQPSQQIGITQEKSFKGLHLAWKNVVSWPHIFRHIGRPRFQDSFFRPDFHRKNRARIQTHQLRDPDSKPAILSSSMDLSDDLRMAGRPVNLYILGFHGCFQE